jgi:hypothetical protein
MTGVNRDWVNDPHGAILGLYEFALQVKDAKNKIEDFAKLEASNAALRIALSMAGLELGRDVSIEAIGEAIRAKVLAEHDIDVGNILDGSDIKKRMEKIMLQVIMQRMGGGDATRDGLKKMIAERVKYRVLELVTEGIDTAGANMSTVSMVMAWQNKTEHVNIDTVKAEGNRRRQKTYRESHRRVRV